MKPSLKLALLAALTTALVACDKPAEKVQAAAQEATQKAQETVQAVKNEATAQVAAVEQAVEQKVEQAAQKIEQVEQKVEEVKTNLEQAVKTEAKEMLNNVVEKATGAKADFDAFNAWQQQQEQGLNNAIQSALQQLGDKANDAKLAQEAVNSAALAYFSNIKAEAAKLNIADPEVSALKEKTLEVINLGEQMLKEVGSQTEFTPELEKRQKELQAKLEQVSQEGQKIEAALKQKFAPKEMPENKATENKAAETK